MRAWLHLQVPTADQVKRDDLAEALAAFQAQLQEVRMGARGHSTPGQGAAGRCQAGPARRTASVCSPRRFHTHIAPPPARPQGKEWLADAKPGQLSALREGVAGANEELSEIEAALRAGAQAGGG